MSTSRGRTSDAGLNRILDQWLAEGPDTAADRVIDGAVQAALATNQRHWPARLMRMAAWHSPAVPMGLTVAGIAAVLLAAAGLGLAGDVDPGTLPTPEPSEPDSGVLLYISEEGGYEVGVPADWAMRSNLQGGDDPSLPVTSWGNAFEHNYPLFTISIGDTGGGIRLCTGVGCPVLHVGTTIEELDEAITTMVDDLGRAWPAIAEYRKEVTLGGERALYVGIQSPHGWSAAPAFHHIFAIHDGRPVVLAFDHWSLENPASVETRIIESFRFLDQSPSPEASFVVHTWRMAGTESACPPPGDFGATSLGRGRSSEPETPHCPSPVGAGRGSMATSPL